MSMICNLLRVKPSELEAYLKDSSLLEQRIDNEDDAIDLEKAWAGILYLLTEKRMEDMEQHPMLKVLFSGQHIDSAQDLGYGPANYLTPEQVAEVYQQISKITMKELKQAYNPARMTELDIYPSIWDEGDDAFDYLVSYFKDMLKAYSDATKQGEAIITFLN